MNKLSATWLAVTVSLFVGLPLDGAIAQSTYEVNKSNDTANVPIQSSEKSESKSQTETKTIMLPTWPVQVPARVPKNTEERPDNPHAGENEGTREGLGGRR